MCLFLAKPLSALLGCLLLASEKRYSRLNSQATNTKKYLWRVSPQISPFFAEPSSYAYILCIVAVRFLRGPFRYTATQKVGFYIVFLV